MILCANLLWPIRREVTGEIRGGLVRPPLAAASDRKLLSDGRLVRSKPVPHTGKISKGE